jgi:transposase
MHSCFNCGLVMDRDWNAAKNILAKAKFRRRLYRFRKRLLHDLGCSESKSRERSSVEQALTQKSQTHV